MPIKRSVTSVKAPYISDLNKSAAQYTKYGSGASYARSLPDTPKGTSSKLTGKANARTRGKAPASSSRAAALSDKPKRKGTKKRTTRKRTTRRY